MGVPRWRFAFAALTVTALIGAGCGDDDSDTSSDTTAEAPTTDTAPDSSVVAAMLTADGVEMPDEIESGVVAMTVTNETDDPASLDMIRASDDATEEEVDEAFQVANEGGEIGDARAHTRHGHRG